MKIVKFGSITTDAAGGLVFNGFDFKSPDHDAEQGIEMFDYFEAARCIVDFIKEKIGAIAPPVAAGSVDTGRLSDFLATYLDAAEQAQDSGELKLLIPARYALIAHIDAWGAQLVSDTMAKQAPYISALQATITEQSKRAEKAEADLAELMKKR